MIKKTVVSSLILSIIMINLILWPYLYKEYTSSSSVETNSKEKIISPSESEIANAEKIQEKQENKEEPSDSESKPEAEEKFEDTFKIIDIK
jgi:hypothetical protein